MKTLHENLEALRIAMSAIKANRTKGILTTLGIIIGIMAVVTTMTAANGLANSFKESISAIGSDVLYVSRTPWIITGNFFEYRNRPRISYKDTQKLEARLKSSSVTNPTTNTRRNIIMYHILNLEFFHKTQYTFGCYFSIKTLWFAFFLILQTVYNIVLHWYK